MSAEEPIGTLYREGEHVRVRTVRPGDVSAYRDAVLLSRQRIARWNPVDPDDLAIHLRAQSARHRTFLIHAKDPAGAHGVVGRVNVTNIAQGRFRNASLGYDAFDPYAGQGLFSQGLRLVVELAFAPAPAGLGLHRVEASVRPGNVTSAGVLRSMGFQREGFSPGMLWLPDTAGELGWRDHDRYAVTHETWSGEAYPPARHRRCVALVNGVPGAGKTTVATRLAAELGVPLFSKDLITETVADALPAQELGRQGSPGSALGAGATEAVWALLAHSVTGGVVESWFWPRDQELVSRGLRRCGLDPPAVPEVWCEVPLTVARERTERRSAAGARHPVHGPEIGLRDRWDQVAVAARPLGIGPTLGVDTTLPLGQREIVALALAVRAAAKEPSTTSV